MPACLVAWLPEEAVLHLKVFTLLAQSCLRHSLTDSKVLWLYMARVKKTLSQTLPLYHFTRPKMRETFFSCWNVLKNAPATSEILRPTTDSTSWGTQWILETTYYCSLDMLQKNVELNFLYNFSLLHPPSPEISKKFKTSQQPFHLYLYEDTLLGPTRQMPYENEGPTYSPLRQWSYVRAFYHFYMLSSYFTGHLEPRINADNIDNNYVYQTTNCRVVPRTLIRENYLKKAPQPVSFSFSTSHYENNPNTGRLTAQINHFRFRDCKHTNEGLFLDTFASLETPFRNWLETLLLAPHGIKPPINLYECQNHQHLHTKGLSVGAFSLSAWEYQLLLSIQTQERLFFPQLLLLGERCFKRFQDKAFQALFFHLLFSWQRPEPELDNQPPKMRLQAAFSAPNKSASFLFRFLKDALKKSFTLYWWQTSEFFLRLFAQTLSALVASGQKKKVLEKAVNDLEELLNLLTQEKQRLREEEKSSMHYTLISVLPYLTAPQCASLLAVCEQSLKILTPASQCRPQKEPLFLYDYTQGERLLATPEPEPGQLPRWVLSHPDYFLKTVSYVQKIDKCLYQFYDTQGNEYQLATENSESFYLYRRFPQGWFLYTPQPPSQLDSSQFPDNHPCCSGILTSSAHFWLSTTSSPSRCIFVYGKSTEKLHCIIEERAIHHPTKTGYTLLVNYSNAVVIQYLERIISGKEILAWCDPSGQLRHLEIPQLSLSFEYKQGQWMSDQHAGFFLEGALDLPLCTPYKHYIVLTNSKGKRLILIAGLPIEIKPQDFLLPIIPDVKKTDHSVELFTYKLKRSGEPHFPDDPKALFYLIYIALNRYDYTRAFHAFTAFKKKHFPIDSSLKGWMSSLLQSDKPDNHPTVQLLLLQLNLFIGETHCPHFPLSTIRARYFNYLDSYPNSAPYFLSIKEEMLCLEIIQSENISDPTRQAQMRTHAMRLGIQIALPELDPNATYLPLQGPTPQSPPHFSWIDKQIENKMWRHLDHPSPPPIYPGRPGQILIDNFLYYYRIARHQQGCKEHQELETLLRNSRFCTHEPQSFSLHCLLTLVYYNPQLGPEFSLLAERKTPLKTLFDGYPLKSIPNYPSHWSVPYKRHIRQSLTQQILTIASSPRVKAPALVFPKKNPNLNYLALLQQEKKNVAEDVEVLNEMKDYFTQVRKEEKESCIQVQFTRLIQGIEKKTKNLLNTQDHPNYTFNLSQLTETENQLLQWQTECATKKQKIHGSIDKILKYPEELLLQQGGSLLCPLTLEQLLVAFGKEEDDLFLRAYPFLREETLGKLKAKLLQYLIYATEEEKISKLLAAHQEIKDTVHRGARRGEVEMAIQTFVTLALASRQYPPQEMPHILVFEYFAKLLLRKEQLKALLTLSTNPAHVEWEARTGFGKSKVLILLWAAIMAKKAHLTLVALPTSLMQMQLKQLRKILGKAFDSEIIPIHFDRQAASLSYLKKLLKTLQEAKEGRAIVLIDIHSLHGLVNLKLQEFLSMDGQTETTECLLELRRLIYQQGVFFFDESRECFNLRYRYDYAIGDPEAIDKVYIKTASWLYRLLLASSLHTRFQFDFLPSLTTQEAHLLSRDNYAVFLKEFISIIIEQLNVPSAQRAAIAQDLKGHYSPECEAFYQSLSQEQLEEYACIKQQVAIHLGKTFLRKAGDSYGFLSGTRFVVPYQHTVRKPRSEFAEVEEALDFCIQANLKYSFSFQDIEHYIDVLKVALLSKGEEELLTQPSYQLLFKLTSTPLLAIRTQEIEEIQATLNTHLFLKLEFIEQIILPKIRRYTKKVVSNAFTLVPALSSVKGASGTVNPSLLPPNIHTHEDKSAVIDNLVLLWKHSQEKISLFKGISPKEQLFKALQEHPEIQVVIDVAASFCDLSSLEIAETLLAARPQAKGVFLHDEEGKEYVIEATKPGVLLARQHCQLKDEDFIYYIRKSQAIGTDLHLPLKEALISVSSTTPMGFLFQGTGRLRRLSSGQKAHYFLSPKDAAQIFPSEAPLTSPQPLKPCLRGLISHAIREEGRLNGDDYFFKLHLYLTSFVDRLLGQKVQSDSINQIRQIFHELTSFLVVKSNQNPLAHLRSTHLPLSKEAAVAQLKKNFFNKLTQLLEQYPKLKAEFNLSTIQKEFDEAIDYTQLPNQISMNSLHIEVTDTDTNTEMSREVSQQNETENELDNHNIADNEWPTLVYTPKPLLNWDGNYLVYGQKSPNTTLLGIDVCFSPNFLYVSQEKMLTVQKPAYQYLVHWNEERLTLVLLDLYDANKVLKAMESTLPIPKRHTYRLFSTGRCLKRVGAKQLFYKLPISLTILWKLFSGSSLTQKEELFLANQTESNKQSLRPWIEYLQRAWPHIKLPKI